MWVEVQSLRLLVERNGVLFNIAKVALGKADASLYIIPSTPSEGEGYAGLMKVPEHGQHNTWTYSRQLAGLPIRVTLHESGRCHASAGDRQTEPTWGRSLFYDEVAHVATISCFNVGGLPAVETLRGPPRLDVVFKSADLDWTAIHIPVFVCPDDSPAVWKRVAVRMTPDGRPRPLYLVLGGRLEQEPANNRDGGVLVVAGWGPGDDQRPLTGVYGITSPAHPSSTTTLP